MDRHSLDTTSRGEGDRWMEGEGRHEREENAGFGLDRINEQGINRSTSSKMK